MQSKYYLKRSIEIAKIGGKKVRPNPQVGAVIVYKDRIIGEGYHMKYGGPHAEVNAINSVKNEDRKHISASTIYVSLEPCCHTGNTPPCTNLIIKNKIPKVCIAEIDPTDKVNKKGIQQLREAGIEVEIIDIEDNQLTKVFKVNQLQDRPFIQLKFAKSKDNYIGLTDKQMWLSNETSKIFTHKLRAQTDAILVGTNTAIIDNPSLTLRDYPGVSPQRIVLDRTGKIPLTHTLLSDEHPCIIFTENIRSALHKHKLQIEIDFAHKDFLSNLLYQLYQLNIYHILIEGGGSIFKSFIKENLWDEAVVINTDKVLKEGVKAININGKLRSKMDLDGNTVFTLSNSSIQN